MSLTGTTGKYQNNIEELDRLPLTRYERIFKDNWTPTDIPAQYTWTEPDILGHQDIKVHLRIF